MVLTALLHLDGNMSAESALMNYYARQLKKTSRTPRGKNQKPEQISVKEIVAWCSRMNWAMDIIEAKAVYSQSAGRYLSGQAPSGMSDLVGNLPDGIASYVEVKAKDRRNTLKMHQADFLIKKIRTNCFAVCADTADYLENVYNIWVSLGTTQRQKYLMSLIPQKFQDL